MCVSELFSAVTRRKVLVEGKKTVKCRFNPILENTVSFIGKKHKLCSGRDKPFGYRI